MKCQAETAFLFLYITPNSTLSGKKHCGVQYQTLRCLTRNTVVSDAKHHSVLIKILWCFTQNTTLFLKNTTVFLERYLDPCEKVLWAG
jgi:hypothetical protein